MAIPVLKLNLVPAPTLWRQRHEALGWTGLVLGLLALVGSLAAWGVQAARTKRMVRDSVTLSNRAKLASQKEFALSQELATLDINREMPRWRLAERIYMERGLPWSRVTAELERSLVDGVRTKAISRSRGGDGTVELKLRGESRRREDEAEFIENLQNNGLFMQVILEREAERQGGGIDFELRLPMVAAPPPYILLPTPEERDKALKAKVANSKTVRPPTPAAAPVAPVVTKPTPVEVVKPVVAPPVQPRQREHIPVDDEGTPRPSRRERQSPAEASGERRQSTGSGSSPTSNDGRKRQGARSHGRSE